MGTKKSPFYQVVPAKRMEPMMPMAPSPKPRQRTQIPKKVIMPEKSVGTRIVKNKIKEKTRYIPPATQHRTVRTMTPLNQVEDALEAPEEKVEKIDKNRVPLLEPPSDIDFQSWEDREAYIKKYDSTDVSKRVPLGFKLPHSDRRKEQ